MTLFIYLQPVHYDEDPAKENKPVKVVYIHNARELFVSVQLCKDLSIFYVDKVEFSENSAECQENPRLKLVGCKANDIPSHISGIDMFQSETSKIKPSVELKKLSITHSSIGEFDANEPISNKVNIRITHTIIEKFVKMKIIENDSVLLLNVTIDNFAKNGLEVLDSSVRMWQCSIKVAEGSMLIGKNSKLVFRDNTGVMNMFTEEKVVENKDEIKQVNTEKEEIKIPPPSIITPQDQKKSSDSEKSSEDKPPRLYLENKGRSYDRRPPGVPNFESLIPQEIDCPEPPMAAWVIPTIAAILEAVILVSIYFKSNRKRIQRQKSEAPEEEGTSDRFSIHVDNLSGSHPSAGFYNSNVNQVTDIRKRPN